VSFRHVALFRWQPGTPPGPIAQAAADLLALAPTLPGLRAYACGDDLGLSDGAFDFAIAAEFDDQAAYDAYRNHPEHRRIAEELVVPHVAERAFAQFEA
jgi:hypothetical protein